jgi:hypothetical protein
MELIQNSGLRRPGDDGGHFAYTGGPLPKCYSDEPLLRLGRKVLDEPIEIAK